jgi:F-type H+-transporting ATPase subunit gamma
MSDTNTSYRRKINSAKDLQSVVLSMKALAASNIGQYEKSVIALSHYYHTVELGLSVCLQANSSSLLMKKQADIGTRVAIVFGSDQGLVGQFNDQIVDQLVKTLSGKLKIWAVGERVYANLLDAGLLVAGYFAVPSSVKAISSFVEEILIKTEAEHDWSEMTQLQLLYNSSTNGSEIYSPVNEQLLPLDKDWQGKLIKLPWQTSNLPELIGNKISCLEDLIREYIFISIYRACAESLASENAARLAAMQRADKNIDELLEELNSTYHRLRQSKIDEELLDVISGFEALI